MPIELTCTCGRILQLSDSTAGKSIRCPSCAATLLAPMLVQEFVDDDAAAATLAAPAATSGMPMPIREFVDDEPAVAQPLAQPFEAETAAASADSAQTDALPAAPPPPKRPLERTWRRKKKSLHEEFFGDEKPATAHDRWFASLNRTLLTGALILVFGIVMLVAALAGGYHIGVLVFGIVLIVAGIGTILGAYIQF